MEYYIVKTGYIKKIEKIDIIRETSRCVFLRGRRGEDRYLKDSDRIHYRKTLDKAVEALNCDIEKETKIIGDKIRYLKDRLDSARCGDTIVSID